MEKIDLSTNSKKIQDLYNKVVRGDQSTTYGVFSVDKNGVLDATSGGSGDLEEFVSEFSDGQVQFGLTRVTLPGSDVVKNLLLGWCPDNAPAKLRLSFAANFADVSRVLSGYHVQITARDSDDLDVDEFLSRVGAAAGARYGTANAAPSVKKASPQPVPAVVSKPSKPSSFIPKSTGKPVAPITPKPAFKSPTVKPSEPTAQDEDEWGGEKEIEERDFEKQPLESVPSAYKPTKVDIAELRKQKSDTISSKIAPSKPQESKSELAEQKTLGDRMKAFQLAGDDGRLTSLPKPKVNHSVASRYTAASSSSSAPTFGAKPHFGQSLDKKDKLVGGLSRNFGAENGKTPAQLWAEKRGKFKDVNHDEEPVHASSTSDSRELESEFKSFQVKEEEDEKETEESAVATKDEEEEEEEEEKHDFKPTIIKPAVGGFPAPPKRVLPSAPVEEEEEEKEEEEEVPAPAPVPSLPARNLPPLPTREEPKAELPTPSMPKRETEEGKVGISAVAQYDYEKDEDNEVEFNEGDIIVEIEFVDEEWWSGKNSRTGKTGLFPGSYVTVQDESETAEKPSSAPEAPATATDSPAGSEGKTAVAEYEYEKEEDNEITFAEGDLIIEIDFVDEDWWSGKNSKTGDVGLFPANYVKLQ